MTRTEAFAETTSPHPAWRAFAAQLESDNDNLRQAYAELLAKHIGYAFSLDAIGTTGCKASVSVKK